MIYLGRRCLVRARRRRRRRRRACQRCFRCAEKQTLMRETAEGSSMGVESKPREGDGCIYRIIPCPIIRDPGI